MTDSTVGGRKGSTRGIGTEAEYNVPIVVGSLITGVFFGGVGGAVVFPTLPTLGSVLSISPFMVGVILSATRFSRLVTNTPAGQVIDRVGARKPMVVGLFVQGVTPFGYVIGLTPELVPFLSATEIFLLFRLLWGIGSAFVFVGAYSTVVYVTTEENRGKWIGYFRGGQSAGVPAGLILGGVLTDLYGYGFAFSTAGVTVLFAAILAAFVIPDLNPDIQDPARIRDLPAIIRADPRISVIGTVNLVVRFLFSGVLISTIVLYAAVHDISVGTLSAVGVSGALMAVAVSAFGISTVFVGRLSDRTTDRTFVVIPALVVFGSGFTILGFVPTLFTIIIGVTLIGIGAGGSNPPLLAFLGDISSEEDIGKMGGVYNVFGDLGATLGPMVALPIAARIGYRLEYLICVGLVIAVIALVTRTLPGEQ